MTHKLITRPKRALLIALLLTLGAAALAGGVADRLDAGRTNFEDPSSPSVVAERWVERATGVEATPELIALVADPTAARLARVERAFAAEPLVGRVTEPQSSRDGREAMVAAYLRPGADKAQVDAAERVEATLGRIDGVTLGGGIVLNTQASEQVSEDLARAEMLAFPILFLISLIVFRGLVASLLPLLVGGITIMGAFAGLRLVDGALDLSLFALNLVIGLGLGLAIDYSLLVLSRYREELEAGHERSDALARTVRAAGRTIVFSALTVGAALAALLVFPQPFLYSMGVGGVFVALLAALVSLTVLPAMLALLGPRVDALAPRRLRRRPAGPAASGGWYRLAHGVMRRPVPVALAAAAVLVAFGLPALGVKFTSVDASVLPKDKTSRQVADALTTRFEDRTAPVLAVARDASASQVQAYARRLRAVPGLESVGVPRRLDAQTWQIDAFTGSGPSTEASRDAVRAVQDVAAPFQLAVGGQTASFLDQQESLGDDLVPAILVVAAGTLALLFLMTGSVVLPIKALVMNLLTLSATFGALVLVFQHGRFEDLLGFTSQGALEATQPIVLAAMAFGLSTDYGVFLLGRIKEARDAGAGERESVAIGVERTGRIVTAAALLFCIAIGAFATSEMIFIKELGLGTAFAVAIDATIVRALLVPSLMALLGRFNWWAPRPLRALHARIGWREAPAPA